MDREILFRGKNYDNDEWVEGYYTFYPQGFNGIPKTKHVIRDTWELIGKLYFVDPETVCQYTGLTDKNGRKIFEGDIVKQFADCNGAGESIYYFYQIRWSEEYCAFEGFEIYTKEIFLFPDLEDIEVIGNIFDNPELLDGSTE